MKKINVLMMAMVLLVLGFLLLATAWAGDAVDMRDKKGVPENLKRYDPSQKSLHIHEPPSPPMPRRGNSGTSVEKSTDTHHSNIHRDPGPDPGKSGEGVTNRPVNPTPPPKPVLPPRPIY